MNALETFANQIETYGVLHREYSTQDTKNLVKIFSMDADTFATIVYDKQGLIKEAKFIRRA